MLLKSYTVFSFYAKWSSSRVSKIYLPALFAQIGTGCGVYFAMWYSLTVQQCCIERSVGADQVEVVAIRCGTWRFRTTLGKTICGLMPRAETIIIKTDILASYLRANFRVGQCSWYFRSLEDFVRTIEQIIDAWHNVCFRISTCWNNKI